MGNGCQDTRKKKKETDYGLLAACCSYNMKIDSSNYDIKFETKERKKHPLSFNNK